MYSAAVTHKKHANVSTMSAVATSVLLAASSLSIFDALQLYCSVYGTIVVCRSVRLWTVGHE